MTQIIQNCPFDVNPQDQSTTIIPPNLSNINYTNQDFWSLKTRLVDFIKERFGTTFSDFVESDIAIMLIENWAFIGDTLSFKIDQIANEVFIDTVTEIENAFRLAQLVGFTPSPPTPSKSLWTATINNALNVDVRIATPVSIPINTEDGGKTIELFAGDENNNAIIDEDIFLPAGVLSINSIVGLEGVSRTDFFAGTGAVNQFFQLGFGPVLKDTVRVFVDGAEWDEVAFFTDSQPRREFRVEFDSSYNAFIIFGNNMAGLIPSPQSQIQAQYRTGGGVAGNIVAGAVLTQRTFEVVGFDFRVPVSFQNFTQGEFGFSGDDLIAIKEKLPKFLRTQNRAVTGDDYQTVADQFVSPTNGQVGRSTAVLRNHGCAANLIDLYILARNGAEGLQEASNNLKVELQEEIDSLKMFTDEVCIKDGVIVFVDTTIDVIMDKFYKKFEEEFRERVQRQVDTFYRLNNWQYDEELREVDLIKSLSNIREVNTFSITFMTDDPNNSGSNVTTKFFEIIRPDTTEINFVFE